MSRPALLVIALFLLATPAHAVGLGEKCGGFVGTPCDAGLWCQNAPNRCGAADIVGTCARVPEVCMQIYKPVCGCDGKTYSNDCTRQAARVQLAGEGACK